MGEEDAVQVNSIRILGESSVEEVAIVSLCDVPRQAARGRLQKVLWRRGRIKFRQVGNARRQTGGRARRKRGRKTRKRRGCIGCMPPVDIETVKVIQLFNALVSAFQPGRHAPAGLFVHPRLHFVQQRAAALSLVMRDLLLLDYEVAV